MDAVDNEEPTDVTKQDDLVDTTSKLQNLLYLARKQSEQLDQVTTLARRQSQQLDPSKLIRLPSKKPELASKRYSEIQVADANPESSVITKPRVLETTFQPLKELQFRASTSAGRTSIRKDLTYAGYAKSNFRLQPRRCYGEPISKEVALKYTKKPLREPLLKTVEAQDEHDAVAVFAHLMAYMGDLSSSETETDNILQVLSGGIRINTIRDEIFCQICKQTTENPKSASNVKGWQAMALSCGTFPPSSGFLPVLETHLEQVANGIVGKAPPSSKSEKAAHVPRLAAYCLKRLQKLSQVGQRYLLPSAEEIDAVEKMGTISATVFLPDSTSKAIPLDPMITTEEVVAKIVQMLGLSEPKHFCLCEVDSNEEEKSLADKTYVAEVQSMWTGVCFPQPVENFHHWRCCMCPRRSRRSHDNSVPNFGESTLDTLFDLGSKGDYEPKFMMKRNLFIDHDPEIASSVRNKHLAVSYSQAVHDVVRGAFPLSEQDLLMLAALQVRVETGVTVPSAIKGLTMSKFLPKEFLEGREEDRKNAVVNIAGGLPSEPNPATRRFDYLDYLKTRYPLSEASWFFVKQKGNQRLPQELFVAIHGSGVHYLDPESKEELLHMTYTEICSWAYSSTTFSIVTGNLNYNEDHRLMTFQGADMGKVMQHFVNRLF